MQLLRKMSIKTKLTLLVMSSVGVTMAMISLGLAIYTIGSMRATEVESLISQARILSFNCNDALEHENSQSANRMLRSLLSQPSIASAFLFTNEGKVLGSYHRPTAAKTAVRAPELDLRACIRLNNGYLEIFEPVYNADSRVGTLYLCAMQRPTSAQLYPYMKIVFTVFVCSTLAVALLNVRLQRAISAPIIRLAAAADRVSRGDYTVRVAARAQDEFGVLCVGFNRMVDRIEQSANELQRAHDELEDHVVERTAQLRQEIERRERIQEDLERTTAVAEAANRAKSVFLANMSHEIRTPLNGVLGFTDVLLRGLEKQNAATQREHLSTIATSGHHLLELLNDILDLSKIEAGQLELECIACSPHQLISEVVSVLRVQALHKGLKLDAVWATRVPRIIQSDPGRIRQLLMNLVGNAIKFTERGSVQIVARALPGEQKWCLQLEVVDTGIGIAPDKLSDIFDPFVQADNSITRKFGGTGLGLAISRRLARQLGGDLVAQSRPGEGSSFIATLNAGTIDEADCADAPPADGLFTATNESRHAIHIPNCRILLVEDGDTNRRLIQIVLQEAGAAIVEAANGQIGLEIGLRENFDLILMDMQMPVMDGYTAAQRLRDAGVSTPIIALTAHAMSGDEKKCLESGCSGYLTKPIEYERLLRTIVQFLPTGRWHESGAATSSGKDVGHVASEPLAVEKSPLANVVSPFQPLRSTLPMHNAAFREVVSLFADSSRTKVTEMCDAVQHKDWQRLCELAHWLKGAGGTAGFAAFTQPAKQLEQLARREDATEVPSILAQLEDLVERIETPLQAMT